jgi:hypothetical protein
MIREVFEHDIIKTPEGNLALLVEVLSAEPPLNPVFLMEPGESGTGYLRRSPDQIFEILGVNAAVIPDLLRTTTLIVLEARGKEVIYTYLASAGLFIEPEPKPSWFRKLLEVVWPRKKALPA